MNKCRIEWKRYTITSKRYWNAFKSLNLNELPIDIVYRWNEVIVVCKSTVLTCAVSPAQKRPFGLLHKVRRTEGREWFSCTARERYYRHTKGIYEEVILNFINIPVVWVNTILWDGCSLYCTDKKSTFLPFSSSLQPASCSSFSM